MDMDITNLCRPRRYRLLVYLAFVFAASKVGATDLPVERYPWDTRPLKCALPELASTISCEQDDWPATEQTVDRLRQLIQMNRFVLFERALTELSESKKTFPRGQPIGEAIQKALEELIPYAYAMESNSRINPEADKLALWKKKIPNSRFVPIAYAMYYRDKAWRYRGTGLASGVSRESWTLFARSMHKAESVLLGAPEESKNLAAYHVALLEISLDLNEPKTSASTVFQNAVARWPNYWFFYETALFRLIPKWGGSWEAVDEFIQYWGRELSQTEGSSIYARFYVSVTRGENNADATKMDWALMKQSFEDLTSRYNSLFFKNVFASYSCMKRDKVSFLSTMSRLPKEDLFKDYWLSGSGYESCMKWAAI